MTYIQYYIAQFKEFAYCWRHAVRTHHKAEALATLIFLLNPLCIYVMYLYDTGEVKPDARYKNKNSDQTNGGKRQ